MNLYAYRAFLFVLAVLCWLRDDYVPHEDWDLVGWLFFALGAWPRPLAGMIEVFAPSIVKQARKEAKS